MTELEAIDKLIKHYQRFDDNETPYSYPRWAGVCPLCKLYRKGGSMAPSPRDCESCPWIRFEGGTCTKNRYGAHTAAQRIERLNKWRRAIAEEQKDVQQPAT